MKSSKIDKYWLIALALIVMAAGLRIVLAAQGWPRTNSDEGTIGLMARHIALQGAHPIFFYGYNYMGAAEAYVGAAMFQIFGPSLFSLRLGLILMVSVFLLAVYLLTSMLYSKQWGLITLFLLATGSIFMLFRELSAFGGRQETLVFGSLLFLCAVWLVKSFDPTDVSHQWRRLIVYGCWGVLAGLGIWSDMLILPFIAMSGLLLLLFCWRELLRVVAPLCIIAGLLIGAIPLIVHNLNAGPGQDSLTTFLWLYGTRGRLMSTFWEQMSGTFGISLPMMTGSPFCPVSELEGFGPSTPYTVPCMIFQYAWSLGYVSLMITAIVLAIRGIKRSRQAARSDAKERNILVTQTARLCLLVSGALTLILYALSKAAVDWAGIHAAYLIGLLTVTPAVFYPLWRGFTSSRGQQHTRIRKWASASAVSLVCALFLLGTIITFLDIPPTQSINREHDALTKKLLSMGITQIYTEYWTCNRIAFTSSEQIICGVLTEELEPTHNRYAPYYEKVTANPYSAYVFPLGKSPDAAIEKRLGLQGLKYERLVMHGYVVYIPISSF